MVRRFLLLRLLLRLETAMLLLQRQLPHLPWVGLRELLQLLQLLVLLRPVVRVLLRRLRLQLLLRLVGAVRLPLQRLHHPRLAVLVELLLPPPLPVQLRPEDLVRRLRLRLRLLLRPVVRQLRLPQVQHHLRLVV